MIILLHGNDPFRSHAQLKKLICSFQEKKKGAVIVIESEDFTVDAFRHHLSTQVLFVNDKLIILKDIAAEKTAREHEIILPLLQKIPEATTVVFFERKSLDARTVFSKKLKTVSRIQGKSYYPEYNPLSLQKKSAWIAKAMSQAMKSIEPQALQLIAASCRDSFQTHLEINKLIHTPISHITIESVRSLSKPIEDETIFNLTEAIAKKDICRALDLLDRRLEQGAEPLYLLSMIAREIKILIKIKSAVESGVTLFSHTLAETIQEHPFAVQKSAPSSQFFTFAKLTRLYEQILQTDRAIKSSRMPAPILLTKLVYDIVRAS